MSTVGVIEEILILKKDCRRNKTFYGVEHQTPIVSHASPNTQGRATHRPFTSYPELQNPGLTIRMGGFEKIKDISFLNNLEDGGVG